MEKDRGDGPLGFGGQWWKIGGVKYLPTPGTQPPNPSQPCLTDLNPCPSDLNPLPIWPEPPTHLNLRPCSPRPYPSDPAHFSSLPPPPPPPPPPPLPKPPLSFPKMESVTNLKGFKNCFNQIHFQNNFLSSSITLKVIFDEGCRIRLCINHCFGNIGGNYMLFMDDGLRPSQGFSLPKVIIKLGSTLFSTQKGCVKHFPNHTDTLLEMVTRSVYNGSNPHLTKP